MAQIVVSSKTANSITVYIGGLDTNYSKDGRLVDWYLDGKWKKDTSLGAYLSRSEDVTFSGLSPSTTYEIKAKIYESVSASELFATLTINVTTEGSGTRPDKFSWEKSTVMQGKTAIIYASDWNALTENINSVRKYKGLSPYTFTTAIKGNDFNASIYNQAVNAIKGISGYGTSLSTVSSGASFTAKRLNDLVSAINAVT